MNSEGLCHEQGVSSSKIDDADDILEDMLPDIFEKAIEVCIVYFVLTLHFSSINVTGDFLLPFIFIIAKIESFLCPHYRR